MPLINEADLVQIDLPALGEWVKVKARLSRGDRVEIQKRLVGGIRVKPGEDPGPQDVGPMMEAAEFAALEVCIKEWSFPVPVSPEAIRQLDEDSVDCIKAQLNELHPERTDDERKNSVEAGAMPSSNGAVSQPISTG